MRRSHQDKGHEVRDIAVNTSGVWVTMTSRSCAATTSVASNPTLNEEISKFSKRLIRLVPSCCPQGCRELRCNFIQHAIRIVRRDEIVQREFFLEPFSEKWGNCATCSRSTNVRLRNDVQRYLHTLPGARLKRPRPIN